MLVLLFCQRVQNWIREYNTAYILLLSTNQIADTLWFVNDAC